MLSSPCGNWLQPSCTLEGAVMRQFEYISWVPRRGLTLRHSRWGIVYRYTPIHAREIRMFDRLERRMARTARHSRVPRIYRSVLAASANLRPDPPTLTVSAMARPDFRWPKGTGPIYCVRPRYDVFQGASRSRGSRRYTGTTDRPSCQDMP